MMNVVLFGPPGAGKGTQSEILAEKYHFSHVSTGDLLRAEIAEQTEIGIQAKSYIDNGNLVPDEVVFSILDKKISERYLSSGIIFDGFPRTADQAAFLAKMLANKGTKISMMLMLKVDDDELVKRMQERAKLLNRSDDKSIHVIQNRINVYRSNAGPISEFYKGKHKYVEIDGHGSITEVFHRLSLAIDNYKESS